MEIKLEPIDDYNCAKIIKTSSADNSTIHMKTEASNSGFNPEKNQPAAIFIKQEDYNSNYENENLNKVFPKCARKQFSCSVCGYSTDRRRDLFVHRQTHAIIHYVECNECGFNSKCQLNGAPGKVSFKCDSCKHKAATKKNAKKIKGKEKYLYCNSCGFKAAGLLRFQMLHELICHKVEKPFTCSSCDYKCVTQSALTDHSVVHIGGNPFPCSMCYYRTNSQENLEAHIITHKPLLCPHCDYRCATHPTLNKHMKTHNTSEDQLEILVKKNILKINASTGLQSLQTVKMEDVSINDDF